MPRKQPPLDRLVKSVGKNTEKKTADKNRFYADLKIAVDPQDAPEFARLYAGADFDSTEDGAELKLLEQHHTQTSDDQDTIKQQLDTLRHIRSETDPYIPVRPRNGDKAGLRTPFTQWDITDQIATLTLSVFTIFVWIMGGANVFSVLQSSGQPVFIERPWIAASLSVIVPAFSACIKFTHHIFTDRRAKKHFAQAIYILTVMLLLAWTVVFSLSFQGGVAADLDWDALGEENNSNALAIALTWVQLTAEIVIGGALAIALTDTVAPYFPGHKEPNATYLKIDGDIRNLESRLLTVSKAYDQDEKRLTQLRSAREKHLYRHIVKSGSNG